MLLQQTVFGHAYEADKVEDSAAAEDEEQCEEDDAHQGAVDAEVACQATADAGNLLVGTASSEAFDVIIHSCLLL